MTHDDVTAAPNQEPEDDAVSHDAIGAYILGALPDDEQIAFESHLRECSSCQQELRELGPIAALLPRLYDDLDLPGLDPLPIDLDASTVVRERIVAEAVTIGAAGATVTESVEELELTVDPSAVDAVDASAEALVVEAEEPVIPSIDEPVVDDSALAAQVAADDAAADAASVAAAPARAPPRAHRPG